MNSQTPKFIDLFSGIGGFRLAFEQARYECVYSCEIDSACQEVYWKNFGEKPKPDITKIAPQDIPDFDVLTAGFPCQPFSICGKRQGFQDTRGTLFFHICEIIEAKQPSAILLENVKHLLHHDKGKTLDIILSSLEDLGYLVDYKILNAKDFGLPQNRERIIIIATQEKRFNFSLIKTIQPIPKLKNFLCLQQDFEYLKAEEYTLIETPNQQDSGLIFVGYRSNKTIWKKGVRPNTHHLSRVHHQPNRIYSTEGVHPTIPSQETSGRFFIYIPEQNSVRKLTIQECYRIMGFPPDFQIHPVLGSAYKQVGNSVCIPMIYELAFQIKQQILSLDSHFTKIKPFFNIPNKIVQLEIVGVTPVNHKEKLLQLYDRAIDVEPIEDEILNEYKQFISVIADNCSKQKGVYTVLLTLLVHKVLFPSQDIRFHQSNMTGGFSGRTIDTQYITPTLKELGLPSMAESGWLTRSLEQPHPYNLDYKGNINNQSVKQAFLHLIDFIQNNPAKAEFVTILLLHQIRQVTQANQIKMIKIDNADKISIVTLIHSLEDHFSFNYKTSGASKLPVIAFYAIYQSLIQEVERYKSCYLETLGSHTASDLTSKKSGDIEIYDKNKNLLEVLEIKHQKNIDLAIVLNAKEKIIKYNPRRYYILTSGEIKQSELDKINTEIKLIADQHGCQIIINGIIPTLKYYLRLITSIENFIENYSNLLEIDRELQSIHKVKWNEILNSISQKNI